LRKNFFNRADGDAIGEFELRKNFLATGTSCNVCLPGRKLFERKLTFVIGSESFGIGASGILRVGLCAGAKLLR
jgi:hypothetical protein